MARHERTALAGLLVILLGLRLLSLGTVPDTLNPDEADNMQSALRILYGSPPENGFFGYDWYGEPAFTAYVFALFIKLFGVSQFAARLSSALVSVASLGLLYLLLRRQVSALAALLGTMLFGTQLWYLHLSRMAWNNLHVTLFTLAAILSLLTALEATQARRAWTFFMVTGLCAALLLYTYPAGRISLLCLFVVLPLAVLRNRAMWERIVGGYLAIGFIAALLFVPEAVWIARHWEPFAIRMSTVTILDKPAFLASPGGTLVSQVEANFLGLWVGRYNNIPSHFPVAEPILDPFTGLLVAAGMVASLAVRRFRVSFDTWLWWSTLLVGCFCSEVITERTPDAARGVGWIPALFFFAALSLEASFGWARKLPVGGRAAAIGALTACVLAAAVADTAHYVEWVGLPETRRMRDPYIAVTEFPSWSAAIIDEAVQHAPGFNVGYWRTQHPLDSNGVAPA